MAENKVIERELGAATAYAYAVNHGYAGTEEEFAKEQANFEKNAQRVADDKAAVEQLKTDTQDLKDTAVEAADIAVQAAASAVVEHAGTIVCSAGGERITLDDASGRPFLGMRVYGKSYNVDLGLMNITVNVAGDGTVQKLECGNGMLYGIPVSSGGNYTDDNGQQWIADYKDYTRGVNVQKVGHIKRYADETINGAWMSSTGELSTGAHVLYALETPVETPMRHVRTVNFEHGVGRFSQYFAAGSVAFKGGQSLMYMAYAGELRGGRDVQMQHFFDNNGDLQTLPAGKYTVTFWAADPNSMVGRANGNSKIVMTFHTPDQGYLYDQNKYYWDCGHYYDPEQCAAYKELVDITGGKYLVDATGKEEKVNGVTWKQYKFDITLDCDIAAVNFYLLQPNSCTNYANKAFYLDCFEICEMDEYSALHTNKPNTTIYTDNGAHVEVEYAADTKIYIDKKFDELADAIINN